MKLKAAPIVLLSLLIWGTTAAQTEKPIILISEIAYDTLQDDEFNEWVELFVVSDTPIEAEQIKVGLLY